MLWNEVIELGQAVETVVSGEPVRSYTWTTAYADKRSLKRSERSIQPALGIKPELVFTIRLGDFSEQEKVRYNSKEYFIISTYEMGDMVELTVTSMVS